MVIGKQSLAIDLDYGEFIFFLGNDDFSSLNVPLCKSGSGIHAKTTFSGFKVCGRVSLLVQKWFLSLFVVLTSPNYIKLFKKVQINIAMFHEPQTSLERNKSGNRGQASNGVQEHYAEG